MDDSSCKCNDLDSTESVDDRWIPVKKVSRREFEEGWEAAIESGQSRISWEEAERRYDEMYPDEEKEFYNR